MRLTTLVIRNKGKYYMRRMLFSAIALVLAQVGIVSAFDIAPQFKKEQIVYYRIETIDEYPPEKDRRFIVHESYMASVHLIESTEKEFILEWNYLPVKNPIVECFMEEDDGCYMWSSDIKQRLSVMYRLNTNGVFGGLINGDAISAQIASIFEEFTNNHKQYSKMKADSLERLKESVMYDESVLREFLELHSIYGNSIKNNKFTENSRIKKISETLYDTLDTKIKINNEILTINIKAINIGSSDYIKKAIHDYKWDISLKDMIVESLIKNVKLSTNRGIRRFSLIIKRSNQPDAK
jgi:hypothetical protein